LKLSVKKLKSKVVNGKKYCRGCAKMESVDLFPNGSTSCAESKKVIQNITTAAHAQGVFPWLVEIQNNTDSTEFKKLVANYKIRATISGGNAKFQYPILQYHEQRKRERPGVVTKACEGPEGSNGTGIEQCVSRQFRILALEMV
jgi:hypothetical protein